MKAVFAGSFDPFTMGHLDLVRRAAMQFDFVHIVILENPGKAEAMFSVGEREALITDAVSGIANVDVGHFTGLLVNEARILGAGCIIRGIRSGADVEYEDMLEQVNRRLAPEIETLYLISRPEYAYISSSLVRQLIRIGIGIQDLVPDAEHEIFKKYCN